MGNESTFGEAKGTNKRGEALSAKPKVHKNREKDSIFVVKKCYFGKKVASRHLKVCPHHSFLMKIE
jgi:hypothetical protein